MLSFLNARFELYEMASRFKKNLSQMIIPIGRKGPTHSAVIEH